jgi:CheY-like chemotaxis protein
MNTDPQRIRVLVVDDEDDMCWALRQIVVAQGHSCAAAKTALEAQQLVDREAFQFAFVDVKLPDIDGFELVRRLTARSPGLPCMMVSGFHYEDDEIVQDALASGLIVGFIGKPFFLSEIQNALQRFAVASPVEPDASRGGTSVPQGGICDPNKVVDADGLNHAVSDEEHSKAISTEQLRTSMKKNSHTGMPFAK